MTTIKIVDLESNQVIEREMNEQELAQLEAEKIHLAREYQEKLAKQAAKAALLEKLGITEEEAKLLLS